MLNCLCKSLKIFKVFKISRDLQDFQDFQRSSRFPRFPEIFKISEISRDLQDPLSILKIFKEASKYKIQTLKKLKTLRNHQRREKKGVKKYFCSEKVGKIKRIPSRFQIFPKIFKDLQRQVNMGIEKTYWTKFCFSGRTSRIVRLFDEQGNLQWSYSGTKRHPFVYHGDMAFHGDYLLICDFWSAKIHVLFIPNETPATVLDLKADLGLLFPSSITTTVDHKLVLAAQKKSADSQDGKKCFIFTIEYLA